MMKETNIQSKVTSAIAGDDGEAMGKSEENAKKMASKKPNEGLKKPDDADTYITSSHDVTIDNNYANWLHALKDNYQKAQVKAAIKVNAEKLLWNWQLGRDLVLRKAEEQWGTGVVEQLSLDLQAAFPNEKGFSSRNLWTMKQWYLFYSEKLKQPVSELISTDYYADIKLKQVATEIHEEVK